MRRAKFSQSRFEWRATKLFVGNRKVGEIVPDADNQWMWRARLSDGTLSDQFNMSRARDAVQFIARSELELSDTAHSPQDRPSAAPLESPATHPANEQATA